MGRVLTCEVYAPGPKVEAPIEYAWLMVMHVVLDHGVSMAGSVSCATSPMPINNSLE